MCIQEREQVTHFYFFYQRTTQLVSLAQIMLDPYFRTIKVFFFFHITQTDDSIAQLYREAESTLRSTYCQFVS